MNLYNAVCPVCGKLNRNLFLEETGGTMECTFCGNLVDALDMEGENTIPVLSKELFMEVKILGTVAC